MLKAKTDKTPVREKRVADSTIRISKKKDQRPFVQNFKLYTFFSGSRLTMASSLDMPRASREGDQERIADTTRWRETRTES